MVASRRASLDAFCMLSMAWLVAAMETLPKECHEWGFHEPSCGDCDLFAEIMPKADQDLVERCRQCCIPEEEVIKYTSATLVYDPQSIGQWQDLRDFIAKKADTYADRLKLAEKWGSYPTLLLKHPGGSEKMRVDGWKADELEEFLQERVSAEEGSAALASEKKANKKKKKKASKDSKDEL